MAAKKSTRNGLAGSTAGKSKSAKYFQTHPEARAKKDAYNTEYHSSSERKSYRAELNKANKAKGTYGNGDGKDLSHTKAGALVQESRKTNRARNGRGNRPTKK
jgi:hypothetical protein